MENTPKKLNFRIPVPPPDQPADLAEAFTANGEMGMFKQQLRPEVGILTVLKEMLQYNIETLPTHVKDLKILLPVLVVI